ncbi:MAG: hypothetical protein JWM53_1429 [bacterium]|nr:hypothetical protein [bacterium]
MRLQHTFFVLGIALSGCALHGTGSGSSASPSLQFDNCSSGCGLDENGVAAGGGHTAIIVNGGVRFSSVTSSNPAVATFTRDGSGKIDVESGVPGTTQLSVLDGAGHVILGGTVTVVATAQLRANRGWSGAVPIVLEGEPMTFHVTTLDGSGKITKGDGSVNFALGGTLQPTVALVDGDAIAFTGSAGAGSIDATCTSATLTQAITVVPASAITSLDMAQQLQANDQAVVTVVPQSSGGPVYTGGCAWKVSDPSITLDADVTPRLDLGAGEVAVFNVNRAGSFTISCTVAGQTATVDIAR